MFKLLGAVILRDCVVYTRCLYDALMPLWLFTLVLSVFLILFSFSGALLKEIAPAVIWVALLISLLFSIEMLLKTDYTMGVLDQVLLSPYPLQWLCLAKIIAHFLVIGLPFLVLMPLVSFMFKLEIKALCALWVSTTLGIPIISILAHMGAVLTIGLERGGWLLVVLLLPLLLPVVLLGTEAVFLANQQQVWLGPCFLLGAILLLSLAFIPFLMAFALKVSLE